MNLFDYGAGHAIQNTSLEAHEAIKPSAATMRDRIHALIVARGWVGATDEEVVRELGMALQTVNPRRGELVKAGRVINSGRRRVTLSGRSAIVWVAV